MICVNLWGKPFKQTIPIIALAPEAFIDVRDFFNGFYFP